MKTRLIQINAATGISMRIGMVWVDIGGGVDEDNGKPLYGRTGVLWNIPSKKAIE